MKLYCSFCGAHQDNVDQLISCPENNKVKVYICNECVDICVGILEDIYLEQTDHNIFYDELAQALFPK